MTTRDTYWKVSLYSTSTKRMLFSSGSVSRGPFLSHQAGYHYHSYSLGLVLKSTITIHEYTSAPLIFVLVQILTILFHF